MKLFKPLTKFFETRKLNKIGLTVKKQTFLAEKIISRAKTELNYLKMQEKQKTVKRGFAAEQAKKVNDILKLDVTKNLISMFAMEHTCRALKIKQSPDLFKALTQNNKEELNKLIKNPKKFYAKYLFARIAIENKVEDLLDILPSKGLPELVGKQVPKSDLK